MTKKWDLIGSELAQTLVGVEDEQVIKKLCEDVVAKINTAYNSDNSKKLPLTTVRKAILAVFPNSDSKQNNTQYYTESGKGKEPRYEHLALKYLTFPKEIWDAQGNDARQQWSSQQTKISIKDMTLETLELDSEVQEIVVEALNVSGKTLEEFIKQACKVYGTTLVGRAKQSDTDLANVATEELLTNKTYSTNPGRAKELVKRAIKAIQIHNDEIATEKSQRWMITQTAIQALTGSKPLTVQTLLVDYKSMIDDHNTKHNLTRYDNRKPNSVRIGDVIKMSELIPDGLF